MKTMNKRHLHSIIKKLVMSIENKAELAEYLGIKPVQVYCRYSTGDNKRSIPQNHWESIIKYVKSDVVCKRVAVATYKKFLREYTELSKQ